MFPFFFALVFSLQQEENLLLVQEFFSLLFYTRQWSFHVQFLYGRIVSFSVIFNVPNNLWFSKMKTRKNYDIVAFFPCPIKMGSWKI